MFSINNVGYKQGGKVFHAPLNSAPTRVLRRVSIISQLLKMMTNPINVFVKIVLALAIISSLPPAMRKKAPATINMSAAAGSAKLKVIKLITLLPKCQKSQTVQLSLQGTNGPVIYPACAKFAHAKPVASKE